MTFGLASDRIPGPQPRWRITTNGPAWVDLQHRRNGQITIAAAPIGPLVLDRPDDLRALARALHLAADMLEARQ